MAVLASVRARMEGRKCVTPHVAVQANIDLKAVAYNNRWPHLPNDIFVPGGCCEAMHVQRKKPQHLTQAAYPHAVAEYVVLAKNDLEAIDVLCTIVHANAHLPRVKSGSPCWLRYNVLSHIIDELPSRINMSVRQSRNFSLFLHV